MIKVGYTYYLNLEREEVLETRLLIYYQLWFIEVLQKRMLLVTGPGDEVFEANKEFVLYAPQL